MEKSKWLGPALFSIVAGLLGVMLIPFQQSCPPEPLDVQCSGYVTPAIDLALLYASVAAIIGGIVTLGLSRFNGQERKTWEGDPSNPQWVANGFSMSSQKHSLDRSTTSRAS